MQITVRDVYTRTIYMRVYIYVHMYTYRSKYGKFPFWLWICILKPLEKSHSSIKTKNVRKYLPETKEKSLPWQRCWWMSVCKHFPIESDDYSGSSMYKKMLVNIMKVHSRALMTYIQTNIHVLYIRICTKICNYACVHFANVGLPGWEELCACYRIPNIPWRWKRSWVAVGELYDWLYVVLPTEHTHNYYTHFI